MTPKLEDRVVYFIHKTLEKAEKDNFGGFLYENSKFFGIFKIKNLISNWVQLKFTLKQVFTKVEFLDKNSRFGTVCSQNAPVDSNEIGFG